MSVTTKRDVVKAVLGNRAFRPAGEATAFAPSNIALCKYWGKRDEELNLPVTPSLSLSLGKLGSRATFRLNAERDGVTLNGQDMENTHPFARRLFSFLDLFRPDRNAFFTVTAENTIPTAAGFASSASGFAAVVLALDRLFGWGLDRKSLSILARLGSGSACRSVHSGFVEWRAGQSADGMDSYAEPLEATWPDLRMGVLVISAAEKAIASREAMRRCVETSPLYAAWPAKVEKDLAEVKAAIRGRDVDRLGQAAESNALAMHATMLAAWPAILYWTPETVHTIHRVHALRLKGVPVYLTMDAGPNVKLLFERSREEEIVGAFPNVQVVAPFEA